VECVPFFCLFIPLAWLLFFYVLRHRHAERQLRLYCAACDHRFYASEPVPERCPSCGHAGVQRL
jgi:hypothetical protein